MLNQIQRTVLIAAIAITALLAPSSAFAAAMPYGFGSSSASHSLIAATFAVQAVAVDEVEPNDDFDSATSISPNQEVYGAGDEQESDYYKVVLPKAGAITLTMTNDKYEAGYSWISVWVYNKYYEEIAHKSFDTDSTRPANMQLKLSSGVNWIEVIPSAYTSSGHPYHFKLTYDVMGSTITKAKAAKHSIAVKWVKKAGATRYQLRYSAKKSMSSAKTLNIPAKSSKKKISGLRSGKKYWVQVRVVKRIGGQEYYSSWSKRKAAQAG